DPFPMLENQNIGDMFTQHCRLSMPPPNTLLPSSSRREPPSPTNNMPGAFVSTPDEETASQREWLVRTPSPVKSDLTNAMHPSPPPASMRTRTSSSGLLRRVVDRAIRRRAESEAEDDDEP
ncbi:hypothetical protein LTR04_004684, partial [Oleoguttula sp. CCFEE 6159]